MHTERPVQERDGIELRPAVPGDAPAIAAVHLQSQQEIYPPLLGETAYRPPGLAARLAQWTAALAAPCVTYVAADAGRIVGFAHAAEDRITALYLLADYQKRGLGRCLLALVCRALAERGFPTAHFAVLVINANAIAFYEAQGARRTGRVEVEEEGYRYEDLLFEIPTGICSPGFP